MAITLDSTNSGGGSGGSSRTVSLTVGSGINRLLIVQVVNWGLSRTVSTVTFNSVSCVKAVSISNSTNNSNVEIWYLVNPDIGTHDCLVTLDGIDDGLNVSVTSVFGAKQSSQPDAVVSDQGLAAVNGVTTSITTVADNCWIFDAFSDGSAGMSEGTNQIVNLNFDGATSMGSYKPDVATGSNSMAWTWTGTENWAHAVASFSPPSNSISRMMLMGCS